ncbi:lysine N(6)-hydroxylase/L-ornithine N(5)-oxygenase family protein [Acidovorax sp. GBBC 3334]|uniref:lysine N(6)-hydroxylase/L-ornithine N(5)-oxygenase family protein n=1 Tax=Acidovorax sp. GBBC 3334 TaxID=2940496 RepID=UPI0023026DEA|nr:lysine N(6)-hydroxylase/L-ornithine N(5)-oxygenase family protein [Acidovorax sp. GBBC 3334]MDA8456546.1 lysine N(6)-hydroxylase/L-ornithine N(5)-oxygenase family protein [Acidovorax sp. GBBC 3334]
MQHIHDLIGIGFGPSNVALAIALEERRDTDGRAAQAFFIERQPAFAWHPHMLLAQSHMQISFLKDLATLRNPQSRFTFLNYLHEQGRLPDFINLKSFFPSRHEFNDYLGWAARQFEGRCAYGEEVFEVLPDAAPDGSVERLRVRSRNAAGRVQERIARNLIVGVGGTARIPEVFRGLHGDPRVFHSSTYLRDIARQGEARSIAIVGAGQSAAEIFMDLQGRAHAPEVDWAMRARSIRPSDDSPFVNEIFNADFTDYVFSRDGADREALLREYAGTNYAVADLELIQQIYKVLYEQRVAGSQRLRMLRQHEVRATRADASGVFLTFFDADRGEEQTVRYDAVVLATGYERAAHRGLLEPLAPYLGDFTVDRQYRLQTTGNFRPSIFLQGACEDSHGLSDTLLSVTAVRTGEIGHALAAALPPAREPIRTRGPGAAGSQAMPDNATREDERLRVA